jgi:ZIP family zinc transporter
LVFLVLLFHSLPEGFAIGTAYASETEGLGLFVVAAIAIQNIPEGTSVAIPMAAAGDGRVRQFWAAVLTSVPQPVGAVIAFLLVEEVTGLLALSFAFAGGAMLALVVAELAPADRSALRRDWGGGAVIGAAAMLIISWALGI